MIDGYSGERRLRRTPNSRKPLPAARAFPMMPNWYGSTLVSTRLWLWKKTNTIARPAKVPKRKTKIPPRAVRIAVILPHHHCQYQEPTTRHEPQSGKDLERPEARVPVRGVEDAAAAIELHHERPVGEGLRALVQRIVDGPGEAVGLRGDSIGLKPLCGVVSGVRELRVEVLPVADDRIVGSIGKSGKEFPGEAIVLASRRVNEQPSIKIPIARIVKLVSGVGDAEVRESAGVRRDAGEARARVRRPPESVAVGSDQPGLGVSDPQRGIIEECDSHRRRSEAGNGLMNDPARPAVLRFEDAGVGETRPGRVRPDQEVIEVGRIDRQGGHVACWGRADEAGRHGAVLSTILRNPEEERVASYALGGNQMIGVVGIDPHGDGRIEKLSRGAANLRRVAQLRPGRAAVNRLPE